MDEKRGGLEYDHRTKKILDVDEGRAKRIADAFDSMKHQPNDPRVRASYEAMKRDVEDQYDFLLREGYKLEPWNQTGQPYKNSAEMRKDVLDNKHIWYFKTEEGFGKKGEKYEHPLLDQAPNGLVYNDMFRAIHDVFAHAKEGFEFGARGEENAWHEHYMMFSPEARPAMTTETRGQNSWVNFGKHLRNKWGHVPKKGEEGYVSPTERPYSEQKAGFLPSEFFISQIPPRRRTEPEVVRAEVGKELGKKAGQTGALFEGVTPGRVKIEDIAEALGERTARKWGKLEGDDAQAAVDRAVKLGRKELEYQLEQPKTGVGWYTHDIADMEKGVKQLFPDLEDADRMTLFKTVMAGSSFGNKPNLNLDIATRVWEAFNRTGEFPLKNPENGKNWAGQPGAATTLAKLTRLYAQEGSWEAVAKWLREDHPLSEIRKFTMDVAGKAADLKPGFYALGPKGGSFLNNLHGNRESLTADMWFTRTWNRWQGTMFGEEGGKRVVQDSPRTSVERQQMAQAVEKLGKELALPTADVQAVLWYYEQQLYKALGARIEEGSYAAATQRVLERRGVRQGDAGPGRPAQAGGQAPAAGEGAGGVREGGKAEPREVEEDPFEQYDADSREYYEQTKDFEALETVERAGGPPMSVHPPPRLPAGVSVEGAYEAALARMRARGKEGTITMGADPAVLKDASIVGAHWIREGVRSLADFTTRLVSEFGEWIRSGASQIWERAQQLFRAQPAPDTGVPPPAPGAAEAAGAGAAAPPRPPTGPTPVAGSRPPGVAPPGASPRATRAARETYSPRSTEVPDMGAAEARRVGEAAADTSREPVEGKPSPARGEPEADINVGKISADERVEQFVARLVDEGGPERFGKTARGARGEIRTWDEVRRKAVELGLDEAKVRRAWKEKGGLLSDVELESAKIAQHELADRAKEQWQTVQRLKKDGKAADAEDAQILYDSTIAKLASLTYAMIGAKSEAARVLNMARKLGERMTPEERIYQKWFKQHRLDDRQREDLFKAINQGDFQKVRKIQERAFNPTWLQKVVEGWKAGLLSGPPTQMVNFLSTGVKTSVIDPAEAFINGVLDKARNVPVDQRRAFAGESKAMWRGAWSALDAAWNDPADGLWPSLKQIYSGTFEDAELRRSATRGEEGGFEHLGKIQGKAGQRIRIPFQLLNAADNFWKTIAGAQELYRQAYRDGRQGSKVGAEMEGHVRNFVEQFQLGTHPKMDELRARIKNARLRGTFQEEMGTLGRGVSQMTNAHPYLDFILPFKKTPINIAKATWARTPAGLAEAFWKHRKGKMSDEEFYNRAAQALLGTTIAAGIYIAAKSEGGLDFTGGGPSDPNELQNLKDTGWQPYSVKIGDKYISYQRLEPLSAIIGFAADSKELSDIDKLSDQFEKAAGSIAENLTDKTFLSGLTGFANALHDPKRHAGSWLKQLEASLVPAIVGRVATALDPTVRVTQPFETLYGIPEPTAARIPGLSSMLPARQTPVGEERQKGSSAAERFLSPFPTSSDREGPMADVQREFARLEHVPGAPPRDRTLPGGKKISLDDREYSIVQAAYNDAAKKLARLMRSQHYQSLLDDDKVDAIDRVYREARNRARMKLYQDPLFRRRAAVLVREAKGEQQRRGRSGTPATRT